VILLQLFGKDFPPWFALKINFICPLGTPEKSTRNSIKVRSKSDPKAGFLTLILKFLIKFLWFEVNQNFITIFGPYFDRILRCIFMIRDGHIFDLKAQSKITFPLPKKKNVNQQKKLPLLSNHVKGQETSKKQSPKKSNKKWPTIFLISSKNDV
jgi:hypothetical protein